jgi:nicotinamide phosphoribosyltransferase
MKFFSPNLTDGYKVGHPAQYQEGTTKVYSNFTPRNFDYAVTTPATKTDKMVFVGLQYAMQEYLLNQWNESFFSQPKEKVLAKYARRIKNYLGTNQGTQAQKMISDLHDLGYLPIKIKALPEGSRVNAGIPVFTITNTHDSFAPLVNYLETVLSNVVWPMCNSASLMEQYYLLAKTYGGQTGASAEYWLPFACHNFALRGHRGPEDGIMSAFGHSIFHKGTDTFAVVDFIEEYYGGNSDEELLGVSVNASEHATVCQNISYFGGGHEGELKTLQRFLTEVYPSGIFSYVSDSRDYWDVIGVILPKLKDVILSRTPNEDGQPAVLTIRPDSSVDTPYEVILGYEVMEVESLVDEDSCDDFDNGIFNAVLYKGKYYKAEYDYEIDGYAGDTYHTDQRIVLSREMSEYEAKGTLETLWSTFGGTLEKGSDGKEYRLLDNHIRCIYGEAISLGMAQNIYQGMKDKGFCVGNVFFGVGSWAFIGNSSRDSYGIACKATHSVVNGESISLQKDPKGTSVFKKSAKGLLKVTQGSNGSFILEDDVTPQQEDEGLLEVVFENSQIIKPQTLKSIQKVLGM